MKRAPRKFLALALVVVAAAFMAGCTPQARKARHQAKADKYYDAGAFAQAEVEYLNVVKLDQNNTHAMDRLGLIYFEEGRIARAYQFLTRAKELDPTDLPVRLRMGFLNLSLGNTKAARDEAMAILEKNPKYPEAALLLAETGRTQKDAEAVRQRLDKLVQQTGITAESEIGYGALDYIATKFKEAELHFTHAQSLDPNSVGAYYALGNLKWAMNDLTNADQSLKKAAELSPARSVQRLGYADFKVKTGAVDEGKQLLNEMTKNTPDFVSAWVALAELALSQGRYDDCTSLLSQIQVRDPENFQTLLLSARLKLFKAQKDPAMIDQAIAEYERLAARFKSSPQIFFQLGVAYLAKGDHSKALKSFNEAVSLDPNYEEALVQQAQLNVQRNDPDAVILPLTQLIKRRPQLPMPYLVLAGAYAAKGEFDKAVATCRELEALHPENPRIPFVIGGLFLKQDKKKEARQEFTKALKLSPDFQPAMEQLVSLDISENHFDSALARVQVEIDKNPKFPELQGLRAQVLLDQTNLVEAESALKKAIELDVTYRRAYMMLANLYVTSKKNDQALKELHEVVAKNPRDVSALMLIGMIQNEQGNYSDARATYEKLLEANPSFLIALNNLAYLYSEKFGLLDKAFEMASKARDLAPHDPASSDTLGWILFKRGEYSWALNLLQASADQLSDEPEILFHLGMTYYMMNDETHARNAFNRAVATKKEFPGKDEAAKRLALLSVDYAQPTPEIIAGLEKRIAEQPDDPVALTHLAAIYEKQGAREKAAQVYEQVLKKNSNNPKLLVALSRLYSEHLNNPQKALDLANAAYKLAPADTEVAHTLGRLVFASGQHQWALTLLQTAQKNSSDPELLCDLAWAFYSVGEVSEAESTMQNALQVNPNFARANQATQFLHLISLSNDPAKAAAATVQIQQTLKADPNFVPAIVASATAAENRGDLAAAGEAYEQILKRYPEFKPAIKKLAIYYCEAGGKEQRAYELAVKARQDAPADLEIAYALGVISYRRGDFSGAVRLLTQSSQSGAVDGKILYYLGMAQFQLKRAQESKTTLQKALTQNLPGQLADEARRVLAQIK